MNVELLGLFILGAIFGALIICLFWMKAHDQQIEKIDRMIDIKVIERRALKNNALLSDSSAGHVDALQAVRLSLFGSMKSE